MKFCIFGPYNVQTFVRTRLSLLEKFHYLFIWYETKKGIFVPILCFGDRVLCIFPLIFPSFFPLFLNFFYYYYCYFYYLCKKSALFVRNVYFLFTKELKGSCDIIKTCHCFLFLWKFISFSVIKIYVPFVGLNSFTLFKNYLLKTRSFT